MFFSTGDNLTFFSFGVKCGIRQIRKGLARGRKDIQQDPKGLTSKGRRILCVHRRGVHSGYWKFPRFHLIHCKSRPFR